MMIQSADMIEVQEIEYFPLEETLPMEGEYVLLKTGRVTDWDRWSILGFDPWCKWVPGGGNAFSEFGRLINSLNECNSPLPPLKLRGGVRGSYPVPFLVGVFSYDAGRAIEHFPATARTAVVVPDAILYGFRSYLIADEVGRKSYRVQFDPGLVTYDQTINAPGPESRVPGHESIRSNFTRDTYMTAVARIKEMIAAGDCYQVNLSQQFSVRTEKTAAAIFRDALERNPAPMMALVNAGDFQIVSTSPERLVKLTGDELVSRPIKGTRPRGKTEEEDAALREDLLASEKDNAELAMIVDLVRNDLGRVAMAGSVCVADPRVIESYSNVHHILATVRASKKPEAKWPEILRALFPGGSVTGCPKVQAMKVIEEIEGVRRGYYCGSIGYIALNGDGDWNIAIRTIAKLGDQAIFNVGGAVVYDSDPGEEYEETLHKGKTLFDIL